MGPAVAAAAFRARHRQTVTVRAVIHSSPVASARRQASKRNGSFAALIFPLTRGRCLKPYSKPTASRAQRSPADPGTSGIMRNVGYAEGFVETHYGASLRFQDIQNSPGNGEVQRPCMV